MEQAKTTQAAAQATLDAEGPVWTSAVKGRESYLSLDSDRRLAERDVVEARREFGRLDRDLAEAMAARAQLDQLAEPLARVGPLRHELERLEDEARTTGERRSLVGQRQELAEQEARERERLHALEGVEAALTEARKTLEDARKDLEAAERAQQEARTTWVRDKQDAQTKRLNLRDQYMELKTNRDSVIEAGPEGMCPVCERPLGGVYTQMIEKLDRQLEEVEVRGKFFKGRVDQLETAPDEVAVAEAAVEETVQRVEEDVQAVTYCEGRVRDAATHQAESGRLRARGAQLDADIAKLPDRYDSERHDAVRAQLRELDPIIASSAALDVKATRAQALVSEAETAELMASEKERLVEQLERTITALGFREDHYDDTRRRHEAAQEAVREAELSVVSLVADVKASEVAVETAGARVHERAERASQIAELIHQVDLHDELDRALHELRLELNTQMRPELSERASDFLAILTNGRYHELELDDQYDVRIIEEGHAKQVISGGEEDIANLVLRLAISQMVAERAGQPLSLLVLDEIFGSLDEYRRASVIELLRGLADRFPQVVLITHIESVRDGVDRVLRVDFDPRRGAAVVTEDQSTDVAA
jgi:exonuclease SbcC